MHHRRPSKSSPPRSAFLIPREPFYGTRRFGDFAQRVGIHEPVTSARLRERLEQSLLEREDHREPPERTPQRYRPTQKGAELFRWLDDRGGPVELRHRDCGQTVHTELRCAVGRPVSAHELDLVSRRRRG
jgi:DNA-binding HxlR family transcriptional regulator